MRRKGREGGRERRRKGGKAWGGTMLAIMETRPVGTHNKEIILSA